MLVFKAPNSNGLKITVTTTPTLLYDLINTAAGTNLVNAGYKPGMNGADVYSESGDIRYSESANAPSEDVGMILPRGNTVYLRNTAVDSIRLVSATGSDVTCHVQVGICDSEETTNQTSATNTAGAGGGGSSIYGSQVNEFNEASGIPFNTETVVATYTVASDKSLQVDGLLCTGSAAARFNLKVDGTTVATVRNSAADRTVSADFSRGSVIASGDQVVTITALHDETTSQNFETNMFGRLFNT